MIYAASSDSRTHNQTYHPMTIDHRPWRVLFLSLPVLTALVGMPVWAEQQCAMPRSGYSAIEEICPASEGMVRFKIDGAWGFINQDGKLAIAPEFDDVTQFSEGLAGAKRGEEWGFIDKTGQWIVPPKFSSILTFSGGLAAVKLNYKWGYIDKTGQWAIEPQYAEAGSFVGESAVVEEGYLRELLIGRHGQVIKRLANNISVDKYSRAFGLIGADEKAGAAFLRHVDGRKLPLPADGADAWKYHDGLLVAHQGAQQGDKTVDRWGAVDLQGRWVIPAQFKSLAAFEGGLAIAELTNGSGKQKDTSDGDFGLIDTRGRVVTSTKYARITRAQDGWYEAERASASFMDILDETGKVILSAECASLEQVPLDSWRNQGRNKEWRVHRGCDQTWVLNRHAGLIKSSIANPEGSATAEHLLLVDAEEPSDEASPPRRFEIFDTNGKRVMSSESAQMRGEPALRSRYSSISLLPTFGPLTPQAASLLPVAVITDREGVSLISRDYKLISNPQWVYDRDLLGGGFPSNEHPLEGPMPMKTEAGWGAVDGTGRWVIEPKYERLSSFQHGMAFARNRGDVLVVGGDGKTHPLPEDGRQFERVAPFMLAGVDGERRPLRLDLKAGQVLRTQLPEGVHDVRDVKFEDGLAAVEKDGAWGLINEQGQWVVPPRFTARIESIRHENKLIGWRTGRYFKSDRGTESLLGWLTPDGQEVAAPQYSEIRLEEDAGVLVVTKDGSLTGAMTPAGNVFIEPVYESLKFLGDGWYVVKMPDRHGLLKADGEWAFEPQPFYMSFTDERPFVVRQQAGEKELFDFQGRRSSRTRPTAVSMEQDSPQWWWSEVLDDHDGEESTVFYGFDFKEKLRVPGTVDSHESFSEGVIAFKSRSGSAPKRLGLVNQRGKVLGLYDFNSIGPMKDGFAVFEQAVWRPAKAGQRQLATRNGYVSHSGKVVIPAKFEAAGSFSQERAVVVLNGNLGLIDTRGELVLHGAWRCGREPIVLGRNKQILWPLEARSKTKC